MKVLTETGWIDCTATFENPMPAHFGGIKIAPSPDLKRFVARILRRELRYFFVEMEREQSVLVVSFVDDDEEEDFYGFQAVLTPEEAITYTKLLS